jgi:hypothetical protein
MRVVDVERNYEPIEILTFRRQDIHEEQSGFLAPPDHTGINLVAFALPEATEFVTVFTEADCSRHHGPDLFVPTEQSIFFGMPAGWASSPDYQDALRKKLMGKIPKQDAKSLRHMEFWRVIMRRNHTFRPVSNVLKVYDKKFYALFAHELDGVSDANKLCIFLKQYKDEALHYVGRLFVDPDINLAQLYETVQRRLHASSDDPLVVLEEIHSRRLDRLENLGQSLRELDLCNGDVLVACPASETQNLTNHFKTLTYVSPHAQVLPQMWHY